MKMNENLVVSCIFTALFIMLACIVIWIILNASFGYVTLTLAIILILVDVGCIFIVWLDYKATEKLDAQIIKLKRVLLEEKEREEKRNRKHESSEDAPE